MSLTLKIGPMAAGKTNILMANARSTAAIGLRVLFVNSSLDDRHSFTHDDLNRTFTKGSDNDVKSNVKNLDYISTSKLSDISDDTYKIYNTIIINEGQFFSDLYDHVKIIVNVFCKEVIVGGLSGDYNRKNFGQIHLLIPEANEIKLMNDAKCVLCGMDGKSITAPFTLKKPSELTESQVDIGGLEKYIPVCRMHHNMHNSY